MLSDSKAVLSVTEGEISLTSFGIKTNAVKSVKIDGTDTAFTYENGRIAFENAVIKGSIEIAL